jgi:hypothetical protein
VKKVDGVAMTVTAIVNGDGRTTTLVTERVYWCS